MVKTIVFLLAIASSFAEAKQTETYNLGIEGTRPITVPNEDAEKLKSELQLFAESIEACNASDGQWYNVSIDRTVKYSMKRNAFSCILNIKLYSGSEYQCMLPHSVTKRLSNAVVNRINEGGIFGDFSGTERDILFNQGYCKSR
ncbi:hypothetical protein BM525_21690 (plasmid) [Alteromonas mediterranea]|uniref:Uncharacterized protein n=1 Tax=Alteromonas mediterranea TaxID=314275 RepID=A0AAC9NT34_9ALTE|nr:hypothetical protein [Alteromonas mediterranea]APD92475.1 hypothetical protein BM524_21470 [Alteromonas mediterranea]APE00336.1 hypothetical protein BM525_21690 [Alteromonas mediterranea]